VRAAVPQSHGAGFPDRGFDLLADGRYEFGVGRGTVGFLKAGVPVKRSHERYEETFKILIDALFSFARGKYYKVMIHRAAAGSGSKFRIFSVARATRPTKPLVSVVMRMVVPPLLPYEAMRASSTSIEHPAPSTGTSRYRLDSRCHLDEDRDAAKREAASMMRGP
jgi:hypothetical protein